MKIIIALACFNVLYIAAVPVANIIQTYENEKSSSMNKMSDMAEEVTSSTNKYLNDGKNIMNSAVNNYKSASESNLISQSESEKVYSQTNGLYKNPMSSLPIPSEYSPTKYIDNYLPPNYQLNKSKDSSESSDSKDSGEYPNYKPSNLIDNYVPQSIKGYIPSQMQQYSKSSNYMKEAEHSVNENSATRSISKIGADGKKYLSETSDYASSQMNKAASEMSETTQSITSKIMPTHIY